MDEDKVFDLSRQNFKCSKCCEYPVMSALAPEVLYLGEKVDDWCVLFIGQNPGCPKLKDDCIYRNRRGIDYKLSEKLYAESLRKSGMYKFVVDKIFNDEAHIAWTNVVKCVTVENVSPTEKMFKNCNGWLQKQLSLLQPKLVVVFGQFASRAFEEQSYLGGIPRVSTLYYPVIFSYHPSFLSRGSTKFCAEYCVKLRRKMLEEIEHG